MAETHTTTVETITFVRDEKEYVAVVGPPATPVNGALTVEDDGVKYAISIALGSIPGFPGVGFIARPVE